MSLTVPGMDWLQIVFYHVMDKMLIKNVLSLLNVNHRNSYLVYSRYGCVDTLRKVRCSQFNYLLSITNEISISERRTRMIKIGSNKHEF